LQLVIASGVEVIALHHPRKSSTDNKRPHTLDDVYGSTWLVGGAGSVVSLWGKPGDPIIEFRHLKQPCAEVGPLTLIHDHDRGTTRVHEPADLFSLVRAALDGGLTVRSAACHLYGTSDPDRNQMEKVRRKLDRLARDGRTVRVGGSRTEATLYRPIEKRQL
jgi:replicative DNA helicase